MKLWLACLFNLSQDRFSSKILWWVTWPISHPCSPSNSPWWHNNLILWVSNKCLKWALVSTLLIRLVLNLWWCNRILLSIILTSKALRVSTAHKYLLKTSTWQDPRKIVGQKTRCLWGVLKYQQARTTSKSSKTCSLSQTKRLPSPLRRKLTWNTNTTHLAILKASPKKQLNP